MSTRPRWTEKITGQKQLVFHSVGDTGSTRGPQDQNHVADKMVGDFSDRTRRTSRYSISISATSSTISAKRNTTTISSTSRTATIPRRSSRWPATTTAWCRRGRTSRRSRPSSTISAPTPPAHVTPEAGGLSRTAQIQPGVFFTFEAPFVRILALYSNTLEDPGVIADGIIGNSQLDYLKAALSASRRRNLPAR